jgi:hypothetical protein
VSDELEPNGPGSEKRRSTRVMHSASITIKGTDALGRPFREITKTVMVNCFGCKCQSTHYPSPGSSVILEVRHSDPRRTPRVVPGRIIWVQRPRNYRALYHVGIEFEVPGNVWDIALPPEDWFPSPEDEELVIPVAADDNTSPPRQFIIAETVMDAEVPIAAPQMLADPAADVARAIGTLLVSDERETPSRRDSPAIGDDERQTTSIRDIVKMAAAEAIAEEIGRIRRQIDAQLQEAVDKAVAVLIERVTQFGAQQQIESRPIADNRRPIEISEAVHEQTAVPVSSSTEEAVDADPKREASVSTSNRAAEPIASSAREEQDLNQMTARERRAAKRLRKAQKPAVD